jgi:acyl-coenzyme A thioesterase 13
MSEQVSYGAPKLIEDGPWAGWNTWGLGIDPFETLTGPYYLRFEPDGSILSGTMPEPHHANGGGNLHGGFLMTFADFALFAIAYSELQGSSAVTVGFNADFVAGARVGVRLDCTGEVVRATRSLLFVRGLMHQEGKVVFSFNGTLKRLGA